MEASLGVKNAARKQIKVKGTADVLALQTAPLECSKTELKSQESTDGSCVANVLVSKGVKFVRLVVQGYFTSTEFGVKRHKVASLDGLPHERQLLSKVF